MAQRCWIFSVLLAILIVAFRSELVLLARTTFESDYYSYISLLPFLTLYFIWSERKRIFAFPRYSGLWAGLFFACALLVLVLLVKYSSLLESSKVLSLAILAFLLFVVAIFALCFGTAALRAASFPLLLIALMVPPPQQVIDKIIYSLQAGSAGLVYLFFDLARVPVLREGFTFSLPGMTIEIAKECSGIRSTTAIGIIILLFSHMALKTKSRKILLLLTVVPFSILKNAVRIGTLTLLAIHVDPGFLHGWLHQSGGFLFFLLTLAMILPLVTLLHRSEVQNSEGRQLRGSSAVLIQPPSLI
jgi:exosortase